MYWKTELIKGLTKIGHETYKGVRRKSGISWYLFVCWCLTLTLSYKIYILQPSIKSRPKRISKFESFTTARLTQKCNLSENYKFILT